MGDPAGGRARPSVRASRLAQPNFWKRANIGMYMAVTMVPMMVPSTTIMIGSSSFIRPFTAVSTSSS